MPPKKGATMPRWTKDQEDELIAIVETANSKKEGFERAAEHFGKKVPNLQQKYYSIKKTSGSGKGRTKGKPSKALRTAPVASKRASTSQSVDAAYLSGLDTDGLTNLAQMVKAEVEKRRKGLDDAVALFKS